MPQSIVTDNDKEIEKMDHIWKGPYKISRVGGKGNYTIATINDKEIEKQWNTYNLRKYHVRPPVTSKLEELEQLNGHHIASRRLSSCYAVSTLQLSFRSFHSFFNE
ncbi:hypothetical protein ACFXTI_014832 [Malus domestica]